MAKMLADRDIRKLLGTVVLDADEERINPNGIEIRLGKHVCVSLLAKIENLVLVLT
jgi:deoxycytidine triphosphate deaminase